MKGKILGVLAIFLIGLMSLTFVNAAVFEEVELDGEELSTSVTRLRDYDRGEKLELEFDIIGEEITNETIEDATVEAFISGDTHGDDIEDKTEEFDIRSDRVYSKDLELYLPSRMDRDSYVLTMILADRSGVLEIAEFPLSIASGEDHKLVIKDTIFSPEGEVKAGRALLATTKVQNKGTEDEDDVKVNIRIPALGVSASAFIDEVEQEDDDDDTVISEELYMRIPSDALTGDYKIVVSADYDDGDETTEEEYMIHIDGVEPVTEEPEEPEAKIEVSYIESQELTAGEAGKMYPLTIMNPTAESKTAIISVQGTETFGEAVVEPSNVIVVGAGETKMVPVYVSAGADAAAGEHTFTVKIQGLGEEDQTLVMTANVEAPEVVEDAGWDNIKKGLEIALVVFVVLLVILGLIIGFGKLRGGDEDYEEGAQTYY